MPPTVTDILDQHLTAAASTIVATFPETTPGDMDKVRSVLAEIATTIVAHGCAPDRSTVTTFDTDTGQVLAGAPTPAEIEAGHDLADLVDVAEPMPAGFLAHAQGVETTTIPVWLYDDADADLLGHALADYAEGAAERASDKRTIADLERSDHHAAAEALAEGSAWDGIAERARQLADRIRPGLLAGAMPPPRSCEVCGCTDDLACEGGCAWVATDVDICTACAATLEPAIGVELAERIDTYLTDPARLAEWGGTHDGPAPLGADIAKVVLGYLGRFDGSCPGWLAAWHLLNDRERISELGRALVEGERRRQAEAEAATGEIDRLRDTLDQARTIAALLEEQLARLRDYAIGQVEHIHETSECVAEADHRGKTCAEAAAAEVDAAHLTGPTPVG